jgi:hypothetical protein
MHNIRIITPDHTSIRFNLYHDLTPLTIRALLAVLPVTRTLYHARVSGLEIWTDDAPKLLVPQENASIFALPGEIVIGPQLPERNQVRGCLGIFYGEGKLLDCGNILGKVMEEDFESLKILGDTIWRKGALPLVFETF